MQIVRKYTHICINIYLCVCAMKVLQAFLLAWFSVYFCFSLQRTAAAAPAVQSSVSSWSTWKSAWSCLLLPGQTGLTASDQKMSDCWSFWEQEDLVYLSQSNQIHAGFDSVSRPYRTASLHSSRSKAKIDCAENTCVCRRSFSTRQAENYSQLLFETFYFTIRRFLFPSHSHRSFAFIYWTDPVD